MEPQDNSALALAFPSIVRESARAAVDALPRNTRPFHTFSVRVAGEIVHIPQRIYHDPLAVSVGFRIGFRSKIQRELLDCILTRHFDGYVRQDHLLRVILSDNVWIPPFVIQLAGEYVLEIVRDIEKALPKLNSAVYQQFANSNPEYILKTGQRIVSYWNCYYRVIKREDYPGFRILSFLKDLAPKLIAEQSLKQKGPA